MSDGLRCSEEHFNASVIQSGVGRMVCPSCSPDRKSHNQKEKDLAISLGEDMNGFVYFCHHCDIRGFVSTDMESLQLNNTAVNNKPKKLVPSKPLSDEQLGFVKARSISEDTLLFHAITAADVNIDGVIKEALAFPYVCRDGSSRRKCKTIDGDYRQPEGGVDSFFGLEHLDGGVTYIVEGEMDVLAMREVGITAISVPNGANNKPSRDPLVSHSYATHYKEYILANSSQLIIATDNDVPGKIIADELSEIFGKENCKRISYGSRKDANDVLMYEGAGALITCAEGILEWQEFGIRTVDDYLSRIRDKYKKGRMNELIDIGIPQITELYNPTPGTLTVITGIPGSGKSTLLNWLSFELANHHDWKCAFLSVENPPDVQIPQLAALKAGKPFYGAGSKMSSEELEEALEWVDDHFYFLSEEETTISSVFRRATVAAREYGCKVICVDPYNFLTFDKDEDKVGTASAINDMLTKLKRFAAKHQIVFWLVAHPQKLGRQLGDNIIPEGYDIAGSAAFFNVPDSGITVHRHKEGGSPSGKTIFKCWKSRYDWYGRTGTTLLSFDANISSYRHEAAPLKRPQLAVSIPPWELDEEIEANKAEAAVTDAMKAAAIG